jgi:hypothetical protein
MTKCFINKAFLTIAVLLTAGLSVMATSAQASTVYSLTLSPTSGPSISGTGLLTLESPIPTSGPFTVTEGGAVTSTTTDLLALSFTMSDGDTFSLQDESQASSAFFSNDTLENLSFNFNSLPSLQIGGTYYGFTTNYSYEGTGGQVTFNPIPLVLTPEPASVLLVIPALMLFASWRMRKQL